MIYYAIKNTSNNSYLTNDFINFDGDITQARFLNCKVNAEFMLNALANYTGTLNTSVLKVVKVEIKEIEDE